MKIAIINLTGGGMSGGYKKYLQNVLPRMAAHPDVEALLCASSKSVNVQDWFKSLPKVEFVNCKPYRFLGYSADSELNRHLQEFSPDVIFVPVERFFRFKDVPVVSMIQNMEPFATNIDGDPFRERVRQWFQVVDAKRTIKKSDRIIAVSEFVRDFLVQKWKIQPGRISVVYHGIDLSKNKGQRPVPISKDWDGQFLFTAGSIRPARGLEDLLLAMKHLSLHGEKSVRLVIAGESGHKMAAYQKKLKDLVQQNNLSDRICWTGSLNEKEMAWCYQNCNIFVMTSRVESFGMIGGEAMSHGCICISADNPCLPELFQDAAVFYPPKYGQSLAEAIQTVLTWNDNQRKVMSEKAKKRAGEFSWDVCAEKTMAELKKAAEGR